MNFPSYLTIGTEASIWGVFWLQDSFLDRPRPPKELKVNLEFCPWAGDTVAFYPRKQLAPAFPVSSTVLYIILYGLYMKKNILQFAQYYFTERISEHLQHCAQSISFTLGLLTVLGF